MKVKPGFKFMPCIILSLLLVFILTASASAMTLQYGSTFLLGSVDDMWGHTYHSTLLYTASGSIPYTEYEYQVVYKTSATTYTQIIKPADFSKFFPKLLDARQKFAANDKTDSLESAEEAYEFITGSRFDVPAPEAPTVASAATSSDGQTIIMAFSKAMTDPDGNTTAFDVQVDGSPDAVSSIALGSNSSKIVLTLSSAVANGQSVVLSYTPGSVKAADNGLLAPISDLSVDNTVPMTAITFEDANLEAAVRSALNKLTGDITVSDMQSLTTLTASNSSIQNLDGIQYATNLQTLDLDGNQISDISTLSGLVNLQSLNVWNNKISAIDASSLSKLVNLQLLNLSYNPISDVSALASLSSLQTLYLDVTGVGNINLGGLAGLTNLQFLELSSNTISDISSLPALPALQTLNLHDDQIVDISTLASLSKLQSLDIHNNRIVDISALTSLTGLTSLDVSSNYLDLTSGSNAMNDINALVASGVNVTYQPQNAPTVLSAATSSDGQSIILTFYTQMANPSGCENAFTLSVDGDNYNIRSASLGADGKSIVLSPDIYIFSGSAVHLAYDSDVIKSADTQTLPAFDRDVANNAPAPTDISGYFNDDNFKNAVWQWLGNSGPVGTFTVWDLTKRMPAKNYVLDVSDNGIKSLAGFEYFQGTGLQDFYCQHNDYGGNTLNTIPTLPATLIELNCSENNGLSSLPNLPDGFGTLMAWGDVSLHSLPALPTSTFALYVSGCSLDSVPELDNTHLTYFYCDNNALTIIPALPSTLQVLLCHHNFLVELPVLPDKLVTLDCSYNNLDVDSDPLKTMLANCTATTKITTPQN